MMTHTVPKGVLGSIIGNDSAATWVGWTELTIGGCGGTFMAFSGYPSDRMVMSVGGCVPRHTPRGDEVRGRRRREWNWASRTLRRMTADGLERGGHELGRQKGTRCLIGTRGTNDGCERADGVVPGHVE